jgi:hypothetical protein
MVGEAEKHRMYGANGYMQGYSHNGYPFAYSYWV